MGRVIQTCSAPVHPCSPPVRHLSAPSPAVKRPTCIVEFMNASAPIYQQLRTTLEERITAGTWHPGDLVPSESELCAEFEVSRGTVRQALLALRTAGLIDSGRGRRARVLDASPPQAFTTYLSFTEWALASGRTPGQRTVEIARRPADEGQARQLQVDEGDDLVHILRVRALNGQVAMLERATFIWDVGRILLDKDLDTSSIYDILRTHGVAIARARHTIDAIGAGPRDAELLGVPERSPILRERRISFTSDGRPIESADDRYLPGRTSFFIENTADRSTPMAREAPVQPWTPSDT